MSVLEEREEFLKNPYLEKREFGNFTPFYITVTICTVVAAALFILNIVLGCCSRYSEYWNDRNTGNLWILPLWTSTPHKQRPLDLTELDKSYSPPPVKYKESQHPPDYFELQKRESDI